MFEDRMQSEKSGHAINLELVLAYADGDRDLLAELSAMFIEDYPRLLEELKLSITQSDLSTVERIAHTLKGRIAFFCMTNGMAQAVELEDMARAGDLAGAWKTLAEMETALEAVLPEFQILSQSQGK
jgi:two-component system, sensor histidine kinase and response regulator